MTHAVVLVVYGKAHYNSNADFQLI